MEKFGPSLKNIKLQPVQIDLLLTLLKYSPNLVELTVSEIFDPLDPTNELNMPATPFLSALYVKNVTKITKFYDMIPKDTIHKLEIFYEDEPSGKILEKQKTVRELAILTTKHPFDFGFLDVLKLRKLELPLTEEVLNIRLLKNQHELSLLNIVSVASLNDEQFEVVSSLTQLKSLGVSLKSLTAKGFRNISRLVNLEELDIACSMYMTGEKTHNNDCVEKLTYIRIPRLKSFSLYAVDRRTRISQLELISDILGTIAINNPQIELLKICISDLNLIKGICEMFPKLQTLIANDALWFASCSPFAISNNFKQLNKLQVPIDGKIENIKNILTLLDQCVNLEGLVINITSSAGNLFKFKHLEHILKQNTKLKTLQISFVGNALTVAERIHAAITGSFPKIDSKLFVSTINKFGQNLKLLSITTVNFDDEAYLVNELIHNFPTINAEVIDQFNSTYTFKTLEASSNFDPFPNSRLKMKESFIKLLPQ